MATFRVLYGTDRGRTFKTTDESVLIGRGSVQVPLTDPSVSRRHAEMYQDGGSWYVKDLHSANGTSVNGAPISGAVRLKHGDQLKFGQTLLVYTADDAIENVTGTALTPDLVQLDDDPMTVDSAVLASVPANEDSVVLAAPDTAYAVKSWKAIREVSDVIGSLLKPDQLLQRVMDIIFAEVMAERGVIFVHDDETGELLPEIVRFRNRKARADATRNAMLASRAVVDHVAETREGVLVRNVGRDKRFRNGRGAPAEMQKRSVICAPIIAREQLSGVIHLDCPTAEHTYNEYELRLITAIGLQTGLALENARLVQAHLERERLAAAGETVAYLSHSIKNILQGMRSGADLVERGLGRKDFDLTTRGWGILDRNLDKCYALMLNMLAFSKPREPQLQTFEINQIVEDIVESMRKQADDHKVGLSLETDPVIPPIPIDFDGFQQVVLNLITNAIDAVAPDDGAVHVRTYYDEAPRQVEITVRDNGPGVPQDERTRIFRPFHSTKGHAGTGLGLAVAKKIVQELGGTIALRDADGGGAEFVVRLPTADARHAAPGDTQGATRG